MKECALHGLAPQSRPKGLWEDVGICRTPVPTDRRPGSELCLRRCGTGLYVSAERYAPITPPGQSQESDLAG